MREDSDYKPNSRWMVLGMTASLNQPRDLCSQGDILHYGLFNVTERAPTTYDPRPSSINLPLQSKYASRQKNVTKSLKSEPNGSSLYINLHLCKKKKKRGIAWTLGRAGRHIHFHSTVNTSTVQTRQIPLSERWPAISPSLSLIS